ncbi:RNA 3'-terminal phosphate cyclase-like protein (RCL1) [Vairimorpha necatrix]|uniref:RNA 3'-terminal phosphate cyclase-like protein (RCL1) n=1 Tax=Vairimorpha necatrix TaxID=6039 RepID=A0AAX4J9D9_9MICR
MRDLNFNTQISLSILTKKTIEIPFTNKENNLSFVKLICKLTRGSKYSLKSNNLHFVPGRLVGGTYEYKCTDEMFNYIHNLLIILPFSDTKTTIKFTGMTDKNHCIDIIRIAYFKLLKIFNIPDLELEVKKRGFYSHDKAEIDTYGGEVHFTCGIIKEIKNIDIINTECLEKTRALLISARLNSTYVHDMSTKLIDLLEDYSLKIFTNIYNRNNSGPYVGYQCTVFCESKQGIFYSTEDGGIKKPEDVSNEATNNLLKSVNRGGIFDYKLNNILFIYLALSSSDISRIRISKPDKQNFEILEILKKFTNFRYQIKKDEDGYLMISSGIGYINYNLKLNS